MDPISERLLAEMNERAEERRRRAQVVARMEADDTPRERSLRGKARIRARKAEQRLARREHR